MTSKHKKVFLSNRQSVADDLLMLGARKTIVLRQMQSSQLQVTERNLYNPPNEKSTIHRIYLKKLKCQSKIPCERFAANAGTSYFLEKTSICWEIVFNSSALSTLRQSPVSG